MIRRPYFQPNCQCVFTKEAPTKPRQSIKPKLAANRGLACSVERCRRTRHKASNLCSPHSKARRRYGHHDGRRIWPKAYAIERRQVEGLLAKHPDHPGAKTAVQFIARWVKAAAHAPQKTRGEQHLARLHRNGVAPVRVLIEAAALFLFARRNPRSLPDDVRLTYAMGIAVLHLTPRDHLKSYMYPSGERKVWREITAAAREEVGRELRQTLAPLFVAIAAGIEAEQARAQRAKEALRTPFIINQDGASPT